MLEIVERVSSFNNKEAVLEENGNEYTYQYILKKSEEIAAFLLGGQEDLNEEPIPFIISSGIHYVTVLFGIWRAGGIAVPLCTSHPVPELEYVLKDISAKRVIYEDLYLEKISVLKKEIKTILTANILEISDHKKFITLPEIEEKRRALIIYTSGSTGRPKGVVSTHKNLKSQINSLIVAWEWKKNDFILNTLPLHHVHGLVNVLLCSLWAGAKCMMIPKFEAAKIWHYLLERELTLFMAVPTIYNKLIDYFDKQNDSFKAQVRTSFKNYRLMVSGSAALPISTLKKWEEISGHFLLERYGMTEIGMALSNPYNSERKAGFVGLPLPGVDLKLLDENKREIKSVNTPGEIYVKGKNIFLEYWEKEEETQNAFYEDWFITGDIAQYDEEGYYKIMGRKSVDIIKTGGYKVSALEIEEVLRSHVAIKECAVIGLPNEQWGQIVCAQIVLHSNQILEVETLKKWSKSHMASYKVPQLIDFTLELPKNAMGKVVKPKINEIFQSQINN